MALNLQFDEIAKSFVGAYYQMFDDTNTRPSLINMYNVSIDVPDGGLSLRRSWRCGEFFYSSPRLTVLVAVS